MNLTWIKGITICKQVKNCPTPQGLVGSAGAANWMVSGIWHCIYWTYVFLSWLIKKYLYRSPYWKIRQTLHSTRIISVSDGFGK